MITRRASIEAEGIQLEGELYLPAESGPYPCVCLCHGIPSGSPPDPGDSGYPGLAEKICGQGFAVFIFNLHHNNTPTLFLVGEKSTSEPFALTIVIMFTSYKSIKAVIYMKNLRKNLEKGKPIDHNIPWRKLKRLNYISTVFYILVFVITFTGSFTSILGRNPKTLPTYSEDLPIVIFN